MRKWQPQVIKDVYNIVGGKGAKPGEHPYQVSIRAKKNFRNTLGHFCGGTIVGREHVVTAAHCADIISNVGKENVYIEAGTTMLSQNSHVLTRNISSIKKFEGHVPGTVFGDIALIKVDRPFHFSAVVSPIKLTKRNVCEGTVCCVCGWGQWSEDSKQFHRDLKSVNLLILKHTADIDAIGAVFAGYPGAGSCHGDSGGPLVCDGKLVGIVCGGFGCGLPGLYTSVLHYKEWLKKNGVQMD